MSELQGMVSEGGGRRRGLAGIGLHREISGIVHVGFTIVHIDLYVFLARNQTWCGRAWQKFG